MILLEKVKEMVSKKQRIVAALIYLVLLIVFQTIFVEPILPITNKDFWLFSGIASLILGKRLLHPHFTPPADASINGFVVAALFLPFLSNTELLATQIWPVAALIMYSLFCFFSAVGVMLVKRDGGLEDRVPVLFFEKLSRSLGAPNTIFSLAIILAVWLFHIQNAFEVFSILIVWFIVSVWEPIEWALKLISSLPRTLKTKPLEFIGSIAAHQLPGIVLVRQHSDVRYQKGTPMLLGDDQGPTRLGIAVNYVGRDDGVLLRVLNIPLPKTILKNVEKRKPPANTATLLELSGETQVELSLEHRIENLRGLVDENTNLQTLVFEVVDDDGIQEGKLVEVKFKEKVVLFQIIDGTTTEEAVQQKNKFGYVRAKARKIGVWNEEHNQFDQVSWLPNLNSPVLISDDEEPQMVPEAIGFFPGTSYYARVNISEIVTHNTAILGILGIGKSFLAMELCDRMVLEGIKFICLDLTNQYRTELSHLVNEEYHEDVINKLNASGVGRPVDGGKAEGGSQGKFATCVRKVLADFMASKNHTLVINPSDFVVSKQVTNAFNNTAAFENISPAEVTAIFSDAALSVCQELGMTDKARLGMIYEEAHSLVPEWNSVVNDGDKSATARTARAVLQGRKFGFGCIAITQRTANVTKTILNQCNTIFAMRTFDDTGRDFLANYLGNDYASILPSLQERHAVLFGKASSCTDPVMLRLNDRDKFIEAHAGGIEIAQTGEK